MTPLRKIVFKRELLVSLWLLIAVGVLYWQLPGFWRSPFQRYEEARRLEAQGRVADAAREMALAVIESPEPGFLVYQGYLELAEDRREDAAQSFRRALEYGPNPEASLGLAEALTADPPAAHQTLDELPAESLDAEQRYRRSALYAASGAYARALSDDAVIAQLNEPQELLEALRWAMAAEEWGLAITLADRVTALSPAVSIRDEALMQKAVALRATGDFSRALELFEALPGDAARRASAELALQLERFARAAELYGQIVADQPADLEAQLAYAYALEKSGSLTRAAEVYRTSLSDAGPDARVKQATLLNLLRRHDEAWQVLEPLPRPSPEMAVRRLQARTALWSGRLDEAETLLLALDPNESDRALQADLAMRFTLAKRPRDADRVYQRLLAHGHLTRASALHFVDTLTERRQYAAAWEVLQKIGDDDDELTGRRARVAFWAGRYDAALPLLRRWLTTHPEDADGWRDMAEAARQLDNPVAEAAALATLIRLRPDEQGARLRRASLLEHAGRTDEAIALYETALQREPTRADLARTLGLLHERQGRRHEATRFYAQAWSGSQPGDRTLALTIARMARAAGDHGTAITWFARAVGDDVDTPEHRAVQVERAASEYESGQLEAAAARLANVLALGADGSALVLAARIDADRQRPQAVAAHLQRLATVRPLTTDEQRWLAGQLRRAGDLPGALAAYDRLPPATLTVDDLVAVGDLRSTLGDSTAALDAYRRAGQLGSTPALELAVARLLARAGRFDEAIAAYGRYLVVGSPDGLRLEMARTYLAAQQFAGAERWAREATTSNERGPEAEVVLAQALYLLERRGESERLRAALPEKLPDSARLFEQLGHLAAARDEHLLADAWFERALATGASPAGDLRYWQGLSALKRQDYRRAMTSLERARGETTLPELVALAQDDIARATAPTFSVPLQVYGDSNDVSSVLGGFAIKAWPWRAFPFSFEALTGTLQQRMVSLRRLRTLVSMTRALVTPHLSLHGAIGTESSGSQSAERVVGAVGGTYAVRDHTRLTIDWRRDSIWAERDRQDPRFFNRAIELLALGPAFLVRSVDVSLDTVVGTDRSLRVQGGSQGFEDGNRQMSLYGHYQLVLQDGGGRWTAFRPNVYWESFSRSTPAYFSPEQHLSVGGMWHTTRRLSAWRLEAEINPLLRWVNQDPDVGVHGMLDLSRSFGPVQAGLGGFTTYDRRTAYWSWRFVGSVGFRFDR